MSDRLTPSTPDDLLVREIRHGGSEVAFCLLYERHTPRLLQTAWRVLGGVDSDAEDAVQEAWLRAIGALDRWSTDAPFGAWVRGIVVHVALDMLRRDRRFTGETDLADDDAGPDTRLDLEAAIASLAPGYRAILVLHDVEGFTHEEIASALGISAGTSKGQLFKARRAVRAWLAPGGPTSTTEGRDAIRRA